MKVIRQVRKLLQSCQFIPVTITTAFRDVGTGDVYDVDDEPLRDLATRQLRTDLDPVTCELGDAARVDGPVDLDCRAGRGIADKSRPSS